MRDKGKRHQKQKADSPISDGLGDIKDGEGGDGDDEGRDGEQDAQNSHPPGKKIAKMAKDGRITSSILESMQGMAECSREMVKQLKKKDGCIEVNVPRTCYVKEP